MSWGDRVATSVQTVYAALGAKGKPNPSQNEWTLLSGVVVSRCACAATPECQCFLTTIALATGTKCVGHARLPTDGSRVHDSHAEVLARRCLLRYLHAQIRAAEPDSIFERPAGPHARLALKPHVQFHFYASQAPCGDCAELDEAPADPADPTEPLAKRPCTEAADTVARAPWQFKSGAKPAAAGGVLRTKPGRGDPTQSLSCSDKVMRWTVLGVQGALLARLVLPIYLTTVTVGDLFDRRALERVLHARPAAMALPAAATLAGFAVRPPLICGTAAQFEHSRAPLLQTQTGAEGKIVAAGEAITWVRSAPDMLEVLVQGARQGVTRKRLAVDPRAANASVCKAALVAEYQKSAALLFPASDLADQLTYAAAKAEATDYAAAKRAFFAAFPDWAGNGDAVDSFFLDAASV